MGADIIRGNGEADGFKTLSLDGSYFSLTQLDALGADHASQMANPLCTNMLPVNDSEYDASYYLDIIRGLQFRLENLYLNESTSCADILSFCQFDTYDGFAVRMLCPVTCGCTFPNSSLVLKEPSSGCPQYCTRVTTYIDAV